MELFSDLKMDPQITKNIPVHEDTLHTAHVRGYPEITLVAKGGGGGQPKANIC